MNAYPSAAEIDRLLSYDPNTGEFRWKARPDDAAFTTRRAGKANTVAPVTNSSGAKGVNWFAKAGKWRARIKVNGKEHHLGLFAEKSDAMAAYAKAAALHFGQFARAA
jgi:hypothetical protein